MLKFLIKPASNPPHAVQHKASEDEDKECIHAARLERMRQAKAARKAGATSTPPINEIAARLERMREAKAVRKARESTPTPPSIEPKSKRLQEKRSLRLTSDKFGIDEDAFDEEVSAPANDDLIVSDDAAGSESENDGDGLPSDEDEAVESVEGGDEEAESAEEEEEEEEEEDTELRLDKVVAERVVDGVLEYRVQWQPSMEKRWVATDAAELVGDAAIAFRVALDKYSERKERRAKKAARAQEEAVAAGWAIPVCRQRGQEVDDSSEILANEGDEIGNDIADGAVWVCCDDCSKWRKLPAGLTPPSSDENWFCAMNPDESKNTCEAEEEVMPADDEEEMEEEEDGEKAAARRDVDSLRARRVNADGQEEFRVRWKGLTWEDDTWEPRDALAMEHIDRFLIMEAAQKRANPAKEEAPAKKKKAKGSSFVRF